MGDDSRPVYRVTVECFNTNTRVVELRYRVIMVRGDDLDGERTTRVFKREWRARMLARSRRRVAREFKKYDKEMADPEVWVHA